MRLLIFSQYFWPENFRVNDLCEAMEAAGHEVTVLTGWPNYPEGKFLPAFRANRAQFGQYGRAKIHRVPVFPRGSSTVGMLLNYFSFIISATLLAPWKLRRTEFDAIFFFETSPITSVLPAIWLRFLRRKPLFLWVLDLWPETLSSLGVVKSSRWLGLVGRLVSFIYKRCDAIMIQSRAFSDSIAHYAGTRDKTRYFPGWPEPIFVDFDADQPIAHELLGFAEKFVVLFAGNIGEAQDFPAIIDAAEALRDRDEVVFIVIGDGRAAAAAVQAVRDKALEGRIVFLGRYPLERMPSFFAGADALLVSLKDEPTFRLTIPGKVQSYLAVGKPIVAMLNGEGARVIVESGSGLCAPASDGAGLARNIMTLFDMGEPDRRTMGSAGQAYCRLEFDRAQSVRAIEDELETYQTARGDKTSTES